MIVQNETNVLGELANQTNNRTVSDKHHKGKILAQDKNCDCMIIRYLRVGVKHTGQVYVTSELKISCFVFLLYRPWYEFLLVWKKDVYFSAVLKFATNQNKLKRSNRTHN